MGSAFSSSTTSTNSSGTTNTTTATAGWNFFTVYYFVVMLVVIAWAVYFSWQWNATESTGMRVLFALGAWAFAPLYLIYSLLVRREGIKIKRPVGMTNGSTMSQVSGQKSQTRTQQKAQAKLE